MGAEGKSCMGVLLMLVIFGAAAAALEIVYSRLKVAVDDAEADLAALEAEEAAEAEQEERDSARFSCLRVFRGQLV